MKPHKEYISAKREFLAGKRCLRCRKPATELHHGRGRLGELLMNQEYWIPLCAPCHRWVHDNPAAARNLGLLAEMGQWNTTERTSKVRETSCPKTTPSGSI
jgi:hypothetical protein